MTVQPPPIPLLDLKAQYASIGGELEAAVCDVLRSGQYSLGAPVRAFEESFAAWCGTPHAVAVNSGTSALQLALLAAGIGPGDEVITVPMTFVATVAAILYVGATPRFVDIDPRTWTMDPEALEQAITLRTKAVMPVHLHGRIADMDRICEIARRHRLVLIEDAAQAHGARLAGRPAGSFGALGCFSFYPGKNLGACGEGGAIVTDRDDYAERLRLLRDWGQAERYRHVLRGFNSRMDAIQGAVLGIKLRHLDAWTVARRRAAQHYSAQLKDVGLGLPAPANGPDHVWHVYAIASPERERLRRTLAEAGIGTGMHYPMPVHLQPAYSDLGYGAGDFPVAERMAAETLSLPLFPELTASHIDRVCTTLGRACAGAGSVVVAA